MLRTGSRRWNSESQPSLQSGSSIMNVSRAKSVRLHGFQQQRALRRGGLRRVEMTYLKFAADGDVEIVEKMFKKYTDEQLNRNCSDYFDRTALTLAITNRRDRMIQYLLKAGVELTESLFYAIDNEYTEAVEFILKSDAHRSSRGEMLITSEESIFPRFLSPIMLAAHKNNYEILEILYNHGHRLCDHSVNARNKWDKIRLKWLYYKARASQAYMILMYNKEKIDPLNEAIDFYGRLRREGIRSREVRENYKELANQCEDFAIALLAQLRTAQELADLLRFSLVGREHGNTNQLVLNTLPFTEEESCDVINTNSEGLEMDPNEITGLDDWPNESPQHPPTVKVTESRNGGTLGRRTELANSPRPTNLNIDSQTDTAEWIRSVTNAQVATTPHMDTLRRMLTPTQNVDPTAVPELEQRRPSYVVEDIPHDRRRTLGIRRNQSSSITLEYARPIHFLKPIEKAVDNGMVRLVTCENSQLALTYLKDGVLFMDDAPAKCMLKKFLIGCMFPLISMVFFFFPNSRLGRVARNPTAKLWMEVASDICLISLLVLNLLLSEFQVFPANTFSPILITAYFWMPGKFINLMFLAYHQGKRVLYSIWNWNDIATILLYTGFMVFRIYGFTRREDLSALSKNQWSPIPVSDMMISVVYILVFLRPLEILRVNRTFGPLQVSVDRMMKDVSKFFLLFLVIWFAFSSGVNTLFWRYRGTPHVNNCTSPNKTAESMSDRFCCFDDEDNKKFTNLGTSLQVHFWSIFGYSDNYDSWFKMECAKEAEKDFTAKFGEIIFALYHVGTVLVLVNMLIAIMSGTLQKTIDDSDIQWQFHRTRVWIRFIRTGFYRPPPMNILPRPKEVVFICKKFARTIRSSMRSAGSSNREGQYGAGVELASFKRGHVDQDKGMIQTKLQNRPASPGGGSASASVATIEETGSRYDLTLRKCVKRYLKTHVVQADEFAVTG